MTSPGADATTAVGSAARRGMLLAFGAAAGAALGLVPYKVATRDAEPEFVVVALVLAAAMLNTVGSIVPLLRRRAHRDRELTRVTGPTVESGGGLGETDVEVGGPTRDLSLRISLWVALVLGLLAAGANFTASEAVSRLDASVSSLLIQMQVLFAACLAWVWLRERVTGRFLVGAAVAILGVAVMQGGGDGGDAGQGGVWWGLAAAACFGAMQVVTRRYIERIEPVWVNALRLWIALCLVAAVPGSLAGALALPAEVIALAALAAFFGPFVGRLMMMASARYIPAATSTLIGLSAPVLALLGDWLLLDGLPDAQAWLGGAIVGLGMVVAIRPRGRLQPSKSAAMRS